MYCCGKALEHLQETCFPDTDISDLFTRWGDTWELDEFVHYMSVPVVAEVNILDPEAVVIGGGIVQMKDFPKKKLVQYILENADLLFSAFAGKRDYRGRDRGIWQITILIKSGNFQTVQEGLPQNVKSQPYMVSGLQTSTNSLYENFILRQPLSIT